ncbi:AraC family transcriptional regulator [Chitinophaga caseinilytica]|uniref:AraC family transcriptional regulator n=1 Tax=Chitinophaga caseinilytica TaxID=2267521 RepID=A0ABZ2ZBK9_9BACT
MDIRHMYQSFALEYLEADHYEARRHRNTYFELVFVLEGEGVQIINDHRLHYTRNKLFVIFPEDTHDFEIHSTTRLCFIRFNREHLRTMGQEWLRQLEFIFNHHHHLPGCVLVNTADKPLVRAIAEAMLRERESEAPHRDEVLTQLLNTLIVVAARNIRLMAPLPGRKDLQGTASALLHYIHEHIAEPEALRAEKIAAHCHISPGYISEYFKSKTGLSMQEYIMNYRMKLVETRLRYTDMQVSEIVDELGFSDASHLHRLFRKHSGMAPGAFRKSLGND